MPDMVAGLGASDDGDDAQPWIQEFATAAPQLQRINDDWEQQLHKIIDKLKAPPDTRVIATVPQMTDFRDVQRVDWLVHRSWWISPGLPDVSGFDFVAGPIIWLATVASWPIWLLGKACGVRWKVMVWRDGELVRTEKVRGWAASGRRVQAIVESLQDGSQHGDGH